VGQAFAPGQVYVALSRLRSLDGLILRTKISNSAITSDQEVVRFSKARDNKTELPKILQNEQAGYLQRLLAYSFDFSHIEYQLENFNTKKRGKLEFEDEELQRAIPQIKEAFLDEKVNTERFRNQLLRLGYQKDYHALMERLTKGEAYYSNFLQVNLKKLLRHGAQVEQFLRTKTYLAGLSELDQLLVKAWADVEKAGYIATCILEQKEIKKQESQDKKRTQQRLDWYEEAKREVEENPALSSGKSGRKRKSGPKKEKGETYKITYALIKDGMSIKEISESRGLADSTIEGHVIKGIGEGEVEVRNVLGDEVVSEITQKINELSSSLSEVHEAFDGKYTYNQLRMVQAHLRG
jgi:hypothetical protein